MKKMTATFVTFIALLLACAVADGATERQKVILDTDLGEDMDDAFALALVLSSPEFEVLGITMDHGLTEKRAQIACKMLYQVGMENVPVAVGRQTPHLIGKDKELDRYWAQYYWAEGFSKVKPIDTPAPDFIIQTLRKYPHQVILFTIGPVTNIGDILKKDPDALKLAKHVYSMYGSFYRGYDVKNMIINPGAHEGDQMSPNPVPSAEWNVLADLESSKAFSASGAQITYAPLDITGFILMPQNDQALLWMRHSPLTDALSGLYALWSVDYTERYGRPQNWIIYDSVAIGMVLWPDLFTTRPAYVKVIDGGFTVIDEAKSPNSEIGVTINKDEFIKRMLKRLIDQNLERQ